MLVSSISTDPELQPYSSFNLLEAKIYPFLFLNLMVLFIAHLVFYFVYGLLKLYEFLRLKSFVDPKTPDKPLSKFDKIVIKALSKLDVGAPLLSFLLFLVPSTVFSSFNLKYAGSISQTLFTASTFFSVIYLLVALLISGLLIYYIFLLFSPAKRFLSTGIEYYCLDKYSTNNTCRHFPASHKKSERKSESSEFNQRFGPYNLHFLNFINERPNNKFNLEELYKHIINETRLPVHNKK